MYLYKYKEKLKIVKQERSLIPADLLVDIQPLLQSIPMTELGINNVHYNIYAGVGFLVSILLCL